MPAPDVARILAELVSIPSVNPALAAPEDDPAHFGEGALARWLAGHLEGLGCQVRLEEVLPGRPNLVARLPGRQGGRSIALQSHLDTVQVTGMTMPPWGRREGDRLYGRGSCDTKATAAAFAAALARIAEQGGLAADLYFLGTIDEEHDFAGSRWVGANCRFDACVVGEPTELTPVIAHKGSVRFDLVAEGLACHSSTPGRGRNAIFELMGLLAAFREVFDPFTAGRDHPLTGPATWTATRIQGGEGWNTVPAACRVSIDRRVVPGERPEDVLAFVEGWLAQQRRLGRPWKLGEVRLLDHPLETAADSPLSLAFQQALAACGLDPAPRGVPYGTDASKIAAGGTPCLVFGPGSIAQAHTADEWVDLPQVARAVDVVVDALVRLDGMLARTGG